MNRHLIGTITVMTALALESVKSRGLYGFIYSGNNPTRKGNKLMAVTRAEIYLLDAFYN